MSTLTRARWQPDQISRPFHVEKRMQSRALGKTIIPLAICKCHFDLFLRCVVPCAVPNVLPEQRGIWTRQVGTFAGVVMAVTAMSLLCTTKESYSRFLQYFVVCWVVGLVYSLLRTPASSTNNNKHDSDEVDYTRWATWLNAATGVQVKATTYPTASAIDLNWYYYKHTCHTQLAVELS